MKHLSFFRIPTFVLTLAACVVYHGPAPAQTLSSEELLAPIGSSFHTFGITNDFPWDTLTGTDVLWDYGWILVDSSLTSTFTPISINDAPDHAAYPTANRVVRTITGTNNDYVIDRFFDEQADGLTELGSVGPVLSYVYDGPELTYGYPLALGDTLQDPDGYCFWSNGFGIQYHFCGERYITFDAVGTLVLPYGTFTDVKHVTHWRSSFETTEPGNDSIIFVRQEWFAPGIPYPILDINLSIFAIGDISPSGRLMDEASTTGLRELGPNATWRIIPNPATDHFAIQSLKGRMKAVDVLDATGRLVRTLPISRATTSVDVPLEDQPDGIYFVRVHGDGTDTTQRLVKVTTP